MKYKILLMSLLSTLSIPYGTAAEKDWKFQMPFITSSHQVEMANDTQNQAAVTLSRLEQQVGGNGAIDVTQRLQALTGIIDENAKCLEEAVNNLTALLIGVPGPNLNEQIIHTLREIKNYQITNQALSQRLDAMEREQIEKNRLLDDVLQQLPLPVHQPLPPEVQPLPCQVLSSYQQELLARRHQIGDEAWKLLGGENTNLAAALSKCIQENSEKMLEVSYLGKKNFKLCINGKHQSQPYTF